MEKTDKTSLPEGDENPQDEEDEARLRSLSLGGGPKLGGANPVTKYLSFLGEVREEMKKVTWPTRKMVVTETIVVLVVVVFFTLMITGLDQVFAYVFNAALFGK